MSSVMMIGSVRQELFLQRLLRPGFNAQPRIMGLVNGSWSHAVNVEPRLTMLSIVDELSSKLGKGLLVCRGNQGVGLLS